MIEVIVASNVLLWITVIALVLAVLGLGRQIGVLLERVAPAGALMTGKGLSPGEMAPELNLIGLSGESVRKTQETERTALCCLTRVGLALSRGPTAACRTCRRERCCYRRRAHQYT
jgi:methylamine dehydrogenase accessory protein MauD